MQPPGFRFVFIIQLFRKKVAYLRFVLNYAGSLMKNARFYRKISLRYHKLAYARIACNRTDCKHSLQKKNSVYYGGFINHCCLVYIVKCHLMFEYYPATILLVIIRVCFSLAKLERFQ